jgi:hypothetical protein
MHLSEYFVPRPKEIYTSLRFYYCVQKKWQAIASVHIIFPLPCNTNLVAIAVVFIASYLCIKCAIHRELTI